MEQRKEDKLLIRNTLLAVFVIIFAGWISYVSLKGFNQDIASNALSIRVAVLETMAVIVKDDMRDIKQLVKDIRDDQKRREYKEN